MECKLFGKLRLSVFFILLSFLLISRKGASQELSFYINPVIASNNLSHSTVDCIIEDSKGFIWIGTRSGLNKFNGYSYTSFENDPGNPNSLVNNNVSALLEDKEGNLWVGTYGGLSRYTPATNQFRSFKASGNDSSGLKSNVIEVLLEDREGMIWIGTEAGLQIYNPETDTFSFFRHQDNDPGSLSNNSVSSILEDSKGNLWIGTLDGLNFFDRENKSFTRIPLVVPSHTDDDIYTNVVEELLQDRDGKLWIATRGGGLFCFSPETGQMQRFLHKPEDPYSLANNTILALCEDKTGRIWVGTQHNGLDVYSKETGRFTHLNKQKASGQKLFEHSIHALYKDSRDKIWIGTFNAGLGLYDRGKKKLRYYTNDQDEPNSLSHNIVKRFAEDEKGNIWIATDGGGINIFNPETKAFSHLKAATDKKGLSGNYVTSLIFDKEYNLWATVWAGGLDFLNRKTNQWKHFRYNPDDPASLSTVDTYGLYEDSYGDIWVATYGGGLNRFNKETQRFERYLLDEADSGSISANKIKIIYEDSRRNLWIGTEQAGLNLFNRGNKTFKRYQYHENASYSLSGNQVANIFEDSRGWLWIATSGGLNRFDYAAERFIVYTEKDGLLSNSLKSIEEDAHGNLWISSNRGLTKFNPVNNIYRHFLEVGGLKIKDFIFSSSFKSRTGYMYFGGSNGFHVFHPDSIEENTFVPPVYLTDFSVFNKSVQAGKGSLLKKSIHEAEEIVLSYRQSVFSFEFAALNYTTPQLNQYAYMLEGFEENWNYVGTDRKATYTNISPGKYVFRVKASNNDGYWNEKGTSIAVIITPPWWQTTWFRVLAVIAVFLIIIIVDQVRNYHIRKLNRGLESKVEARTRLIESQKQEISAQHDVLDHLNRLVSQKNQELEQKVEERTKELLDYTQQLEQFAFIAGHNLRAPVARILGLGQILKFPQIEREEERFLIDKMIMTAEDLDKVVKDINMILELSKEKELPLTEINLAEEIKVIKGSLENEIWETQTIITEDFSGLVTVKTVKPYFDSILYNLISNAIKYRNPEKKPQIQVTAQVLGEEICLSVSDNGLGIDLASHQKNLFSLYKRFHTHVEGKGMGLYLVKTQVKALGGRVEVESQVNKGTTFKIYLKRQEADPSVTDLNNIAEE